MRWTNEARVPIVAKENPLLAPAGSWWPWGYPQTLESFAGAWQMNVTVDQTLVSAYWAIFSCVTLISKDVSKLPIRVMQFKDGLKVETSLRPVLQTPNHFQTTLEFFFNWMACQLLHGNTYILKRRDDRGFVDAMYILSPFRVRPLVTDDGSVYYQLAADNLANLNDSQLIVPASEIIHDRMYTLHHPLIGVSPIFACGVAAMQGLAIQDNSSKFFQNMSRPSGVLTAPGSISNDVAARLKAAWETNFSGSNIGKVAVLGDNLKYEPMSVNAHDAQLIEQLKMTGEMIAACFHVPGYKIGVGPQPTVNNTAALNQQYYDQCLQYLIEKAEARLNEGLELEFPFEVEFNLNNLLRMDPATRYDSHQKAIAGAWKSPNEVRREENLASVRGGDSVYMQSQNHSLSALDQRDKEAADGKPDVQAEALNGAQVTALQGILLAVAIGQMPPETAKAAIAAAFPLITQAEVNSMVDPLVGFVPTTTDPNAANPIKPGDKITTATDDAEDDDEEPDVDKLLALLVSKGVEAMYA